MAKMSEKQRQLLHEAALAWAEFLYDEFQEYKHKQLLLHERDKKINIKGGKPKSNEGEM